LDETGVDFCCLPIDNQYEIPKILLEKRAKQYEISNKKLLDFCKELSEKSETALDYVIVEFL
jgi:hypothetical protein